MTRILASVNGKHVANLHTIAAYAAFLGSLAIGLGLHYEKVITWNISC